MRCSVTLEKCCSQQKKVIPPIQLHWCTPVEFLFLLSVYHMLQRSDTKVPRNCRNPQPCMRRRKQAHSYFILFYSIILLFYHIFSDSRLYYCNSFDSLVESVKTDGTDRVTHYRNETFNWKFKNIAVDEKFIYLSSYAPNRQEYISSKSYKFH